MISYTAQPQYELRSKLLVRDSYEDYIGSSLQDSRFVQGVLTMAHMPESEVLKPTCWRLPHNACV